MTGFGSFSAQHEDVKIIAEVKTLNHRFGEVALRLPSVFAAKELELRNLCISELKRGKIYATLAIETPQNNYSIIQYDLVKKYYEDLLALAEQLNVPTNNLLQTILTFPEVRPNHRAEGLVLSDLDERAQSLWENAQMVFKEALARVKTYRENEGLALHADIQNRVLFVQDLVVQLEALEKEQRDQIASRISQKFDSLQLNVDQLRLEQEILIYAERASIAEEIVRLRAHCAFFIDILEHATSQGKKLLFITQEMMRELNTINAKAVFMDIQKLAIEAKEQTDNIKEQLLNVL